MIIDTALQEREKSGKPIRVGIIGAGAAGRAIALQLATPPPGIRLAAIVNRTPEHGERAFREAGVGEWRCPDSVRDAERSINQGISVLTDDPSVVTNCEARADRAGVVITHTDGEEPGVAMTLLRYLRAVGLRPVAAGNLKGMVDHYRTPETQRTFALKYDQDPRKVTSFADAAKLSMETTILANATGFQAGRRGMYGPACEHVREMAKLLPADQMLETGLVDYALGAAPHTGAFVVVYEDKPLKQAQLGYVKMGDGPFYVFYTPYHLPHIQIASTIGRAVVHGDPTVAPIAGPVCEVITLAKRDMKAGERLDGVGGFCVYGLIDNTAAARAIDALPLSLSENCMLCRDVAKDEVISFRDVEEPTRGVVDELWSEQLARWPLAKQASRRISPM